MTVNETIIPFKLDTGAQVNLLSVADYSKLKVKSKIHPVNIKVTGYTGESMPVKGSCVATFQPIYRSLSACEKLDLVKRVFVVASELNNDQDALMTEYKDVFEGLGCLPGEHRIHADENVAPVVHACRKVPFALRERLKEN